MDGRESNTRVKLLDQKVPHGEAIVVITAGDSNIAVDRTALLSSLHITEHLHVLPSAQSVIPQYLKDIVTSPLNTQLRIL